MKRKVSLCMFLLGITCMLNAQDVILKTNGDEIQVKVQEVGDNEVKYKKFGNESGPTYTMLKSEIFMITYKGGAKDVFGRGQKTAVVPSAQISAQQVGAANLPSASKAYKILDYYNENGVQGIVVKVTEGGLHGLVLSTKTFGGAWGKNKKLKNATEAFSEDDGMKNMEAIVNFINSGKAVWEDFPVFQWAKNLGTGWYIPASDELQEILVNINDGSMDFDYSKFDKLESALAKCNGNTIYHRGSGSMSWNFPNFLIMYTSTEAAKGKVYCVGAWADSMGQSIKALSSGVGFKIKAAPQPKSIWGSGLSFGTRAVHKF